MRLRVTMGPAMRLLAMLVLSGCGRLGFDDVLLGVQDAQEPDGPPGDGPPADDGPHDAPAVRACHGDARYVPSAGLASTYREVDLQTSWAQARADCMADDADLWVVESALEQAAFDGDWIGITDVATEGVWLKVDGTPATFLPFEVGQPDGGASENCLRTDSAGFEDRECTDDRDYVCECPAP